LAVIPDSVCKKIDLQPGWPSRFKANMDEYKRNFQGFCEWKFQDAELETGYADFVENQKASDMTLQADLREYEGRINSVPSKQKEINSDV